MKMGEDGKNKSTLKYLLQGVNSWRLGQCPEYMDKITRLHANTLFKVRKGMLEIQNNFSNMYPNNIYCVCQ